LATVAVVPMESVAPRKLVAPCARADLITRAKSRYILSSQPSAQLAIPALPDGANHGESSR
jgi:hypothetical protein